MSLKRQRDYIVSLEDKGVIDFYLLHWQERDVLHIQLDPNSMINIEIHSEHLMDISTRMVAKKQLWNGCVVVQRNQSFEAIPLKIA